MLRPALFALPCVLALWAVPAAAQRSAVDLLVGKDVTADYVQQVAMHDMFRVETGKVALRRSRAPEIRLLAQQVLDDHGWLGAQLAQSLEEVAPKPELPSRLDRPHKALLAGLNAAPAADFDRMFVRLQVRATEDLLAQHTRYAVTGPVDGLRLLAETAKPVVQGHLKALRALPPIR